jgi:hypothetical protein
MNTSINNVVNTNLTQTQGATMNYISKALKETLSQKPTWNSDKIRKVARAMWASKKYITNPEQGVFINVFIQECVKAQFECGGKFMSTHVVMAVYENVRNEGKMFNPAEAPVAAVFNEYFGGGMNTVVFQELREARGLAYSARAYYYNMPIKNHPQYGTTYIISQNDKMMDCIRVFKEILDTIPQNEANFNLAKQSLPFFILCLNLFF